MSVGNSSTNGLGVFLSLKTKHPHMYSREEGGGGRRRREGGGGRRDIRWREAGHKLEIVGLTRHIDSNLLSPAFPNIARQCSERMRAE